MVLSRRVGGVRSADAPHRASQAAERGSQVLEFALVMPAVLALLGLLVHAALLGADLVTVQGLARETARTAAVADDAAARARASDAAGGRELEIGISPASGARARGDLVTVHVRMRSRAFETFGVPVWVPAQATMQVEDR